MKHDPLNTVMQLIFKFKYCPIPVRNWILMKLEPVIILMYMRGWTNVKPVSLFAPSDLV